MFPFHPSTTSFLFLPSPTPVLLLLLLLLLLWRKKARLSLQCWSPDPTTTDRPDCRALRQRALHAEATQKPANGSWAVRRARQRRERRAWGCGELNQNGEEKGDNCRICAEKKESKRKKMEVVVALLMCVNERTTLRPRCRGRRQQCQRWGLEGGEDEEDKMASMWKKGNDRRKNGSESESRHYFSLELWV